MLTGTRADRITVRSLLEELCARNASAELQYAQSPDDIRTSRVRLLALEKEVVYTDMLQTVQDDSSVREGQSLTVYVMHKQSRLAFDSQVLRLRSLLRLNARQRVVAMSLRAPMEIRNQQRRRDFRVSMVSQSIACELISESARHPYACDLGCAIRRAMIVDLSARGILVVASQEAGQTWSVGQRLLARFALPEDEDPQEHIVVAEIRHAFCVEGQDTVRLGMALQPLPGAPWQQQTHRLNAYVAGEQRRQLRRRR